MRAPIHCLASVALITLALASPPALAAPDEKLRAAAEAAQPALIDTLRDMVMIESGSADVSTAIASTVPALPTTRAASR